MSIFENDKKKKKEGFRTGLQFLDRLATELAFPSVQRGLAVVPSAGTASGYKMRI